MVEAEAPLALMFLNNNLHALHHAEPGLAWYRLPARYRQRRAELLAENGIEYVDLGTEFAAKPEAIYWGMLKMAEPEYASPMRWPNRRLSKAAKGPRPTPVGLP